MPQKSERLTLRLFEVVHKLLKPWLVDLHMVISLKYLCSLAPLSQFIRTHMKAVAIAHANEIYRASTPVIRIQGIGGRLWKRNVATGARIGLWLQAKYEVLNQTVWEAIVKRYSMNVLAT